MKRYILHQNIGLKQKEGKRTQLLKSTSECKYFHEQKGLGFLGLGRVFCQLVKFSSRTRINFDHKDVTLNSLVNLYRRPVVEGLGRNGEIGSVM